jgi:FkbM family methyltransferase
MLLRLKHELLRTPLEPAGRVLAYRIAPAWEAALRPECADILFEPLFMMRALPRLISRDTNCIDAGSHIGSFLSVISKLAPDGRHIAIEPTPKKARWIARKFPSGRVIEAALADESGSRQFWEDARRPGFSRLAEARDASSQSRRAYQVAVTTLDEVTRDAPRIGFIKLDVEGGELAAVQGGRALIARDRPVILFECGAEAAGEPIFDLLSGAGYSIVTARGFLFGEAPLTAAQFDDRRRYPAQAFNFIAQPRYNIGR